MSLVRDRCICLRKTEYSETSQILTLFGRERGIVRVIAKGAHRTTKAGASKFSGGVDLLDIGEAVFSLHTERELSTLCEWNLQEGHLDLRRKLRPVYLGLYAAELVGALVEEHDPHPDVFDRLESALIDFCTPRLEETFLAFELDLLRESGFMPQLQACVLCGVEITDQAFFSPNHAGAVCRNCENSAPDRSTIDPRLIRLVQAILRLPRANGSPQRLPHLTRHQTDPLNRLLAEHVEHTLSKRLRLRDYILK